MHRKYRVVRGRLFGFHSQMIELTLTLIAFLFPLAFSPGPGNMFFAANGARFGLRATLPANAGYHLATWIVTLIIGIGFAAAANMAPSVFQVIKIAGSLYVLWIAFKLFNAGTLSASGDARPATFLDGAALLALNPKAYMIIALMFTQFLGQGQAQGHNQNDSMMLIILMTTVFTLNNLAAFLTWTVLGDRLAARFRKKGDARMLNRIFGGILGVVGIWMLVS